LNIQGLIFIIDLSDNRVVQISAFLINKEWKKRQDNPDSREVCFLKNILKFLPTHPVVYQVLKDYLLQFKLYYCFYSCITAFSVVYLLRN